MSTPTTLARRLYDAMAHSDGEAIFALLTDDFVGTVSDGMPHGVGGEHHGATDMITDVWGRIASVYDMHVDPHDYLQVDNERVVVLGRYWGPARDGGSAVDAAFAHIITTRGDRIAALQQITDTARWGVAPTS
jgi:2-(1,2-epoxy-1,2-dihydrophenyl)acetyl-CoA isomerase